LESGEAIDDVLSDGQSAGFTVDAVRAPNGKHVFKDIQPVE